MSRIDELIEELCPEGVRKVRLGELEDQGIVKLGRGNVISKSDLAEHPGDYPVYSSSAAGNGEFGRYGRFMFDDERITWSVDGGGKFFYRPAHKYSVTNVAGWIQIREIDKLLSRYLFFVLTNLWAQRTYNYTVKAHPSVIRDDYVIPIPPLEVQREIVSILDKFTQLEAELEAELEARRIQYEVTRDRLLDFSGDLKGHPLLREIRALYGGLIPQKKLGDVGVFIRGSGLEKKDLLEAGKPAVHYGEVHTHYGFWIQATKSFVSDAQAEKMRKADPGDVVLVTTSENQTDVGKPLAWLGTDPLSVGGESYIFKSGLDPLFACQVFMSSAFKRDAKRYISGTKVKRLSSDSLERIKIPVPPLAIQAKVGIMLRDLDALVNDINIGLPAEISARRKQYEYFRNKLLTFKELESA